MNVNLWVIVFALVLHQTQGLQLQSALGKSKKAMAMHSYGNLAAAVEIDANLPLSHFPGGDSINKKAILLLGDSRSRYLYHSKVKHVCTKSPYLHEYRWIKPGYFSEKPFGPYKNSYGVDLFRFEMSAGSRCDQLSPFSTIGLFSHFGVSPDGMYSDGWKLHRHTRWNGPGSQSDSSQDDLIDWSVGPSVLEDSVAITLEAARRFLTNTVTTTGCIVYSSALWDTIRYVALQGPMYEYPTLAESVSIWEKEFERNLTSVIRSLKDIAKPYESGLIMVKDHNVMPYAHWPRQHHIDVPYAWRQRLGNETIIPIIQNVTSRVAQRENIEMVDTQSLLEESYPLRMYDGFRDHIHQSDTFGDIMWANMMNACDISKAKNKKKQ